MRKYETLNGLKSRKEYFISYYRGLKAFMSTERILLELTQKECDDINAEIVRLESVLNAMNFEFKEVTSTMNDNRYKVEKQNYDLGQL